MMMMRTAMIGCAVALGALAAAEESGWDQVTKLIHGYNEEPVRSRRQEEPNFGRENSTKITNKPLDGYIQNPDIFSVDYCARYQCKCFRPFTTDPSISWIMGTMWSTSVKSGIAEPGCVNRTVNGKKEVVCMWDKRVCDCSTNEFFENNGIEFVYPQRVNSSNVSAILEANEANASTGSLGLMRLKAMRANRISDTSAKCISCQTGFTLSGGQCYAGGATNPAITMAIVVGLFTVPSIIGIWYVLHAIVDPTDTGMEVADIKKSS